MRRKNTVAHGARYPWSEWFTEELITLRRGKDYAGTSHGFGITARQAAYKLGLRLEVYVQAESVALRVAGEYRPREKTA